MAPVAQLKAQLKAQIKKKIETPPPIPTIKTATKPSNNNAMTNNDATAPMTMINGAFVLKMKTQQWKLCVVKQAPDQSTSSWMLFGKNKYNKATFQMEFKPYQERMLINHLVKLARSDHDHAHDDNDAELRLVLVAESPAISCIESLWSLNGIEMHRDKPKYLHEALHHDVNMLSISPQIQGNQTQMQGNQTQGNQTHEDHSPRHPMQTRSKASRH